MMSKTGIHLPTTLKFLRSEERYSVYVDADGDEVYLAHGTGIEMVDSVEELDLPALLEEFRSREEYVFWSHWSLKAKFLDDYLPTLVVDDGEIDDLATCFDCWWVGWSDDTWTTGDGTKVCETCRDSYWCCVRCDNLYRSTTTTLEDEEVCGSCRDAYWSWCEDCDGYFRDENSGEHRHMGGCDCEAPSGLSFRVRNDGAEPLANDTRAKVTLPAGMISDEGIGQMALLLRRWKDGDLWSRFLDIESDPDKREESRELADLREKISLLSCRLDEVGTTWQTKRGNFTKRLSRFAYQEYGIKLPPDIISGIGNVGSNHSRAVDFEIEVTRNLNLPREEFANEDSCWWTDYHHARCALKSNGGFGLRTMQDYTYSNDCTATSVNGRAWVMPLRATGALDVNDRPVLVPTFETLNPDAFVVFNGYGDLEGYNAPRLIAHMAGMTYRKISFSCSYMYINSDAGYLVASEEIAEPYTDGNLALSVQQHSNLFETEADEARNQMENAHV